jgi:hypothetical protein
MFQYDLLLKRFQSKISEQRINPASLGKPRKQAGSYRFSIKAAHFELFLSDFFPKRKFIKKNVLRIRKKTFYS